MILISTSQAASLIFISGLQANLDDSTHGGELTLRPHVYGQPASPYHSTPVGSPEPSRAPPVEVSYVAPQNCEIEFSVLVTNISDMIQQGSNSQHFASIKQALAHVTVHPMCPKPLFSDVELTQIKQTKNVFELAEMCRTHWSWNNYSLLKLIVKKSGSKDAKTELQRFNRTVNARKKLKELESSWLHDGKSCPEGFQSMMVIVDEDYDEITIEQLDKVEKFISENTGLRSQAMLVNTFSETNSVLIKWWIPGEVVPFAVMMAFQNKEKFLRQSFLLLRIAGMDVFNLCRPSPQVCIYYVSMVCTLYVLCELSWLNVCMFVCAYVSMCVCSVCVRVCVEKELRNCYCTNVA